MIAPRNKKRPVRAPQSGEDLLRSGAKRPGVRELIRVYGDWQEVEASVCPYCLVPVEAVTPTASNSSQPLSW